MTNPTATSLTGSGARYAMFLFKVNDDRQTATLVVTDGERTHKAPPETEFLDSLRANLGLSLEDLEQFHPDGLGKAYAVCQARISGLSPDSSALHIQIPAEVGEWRNRPYGYAANVQSQFLKGMLLHWKAYGQLPDVPKE